MDERADLPRRDDGDDGDVLASAARIGSELRALRPPAPAEPVPLLEQTVRSLEGQRAWLGDYAAWQQGYPVGSGLIERAVAIVINWRMKGRGMRWRRANASAVVALRVRHLNARGASDDEVLLLVA